MPRSTTVARRRDVADAPRRPRAEADARFTIDRVYRPERDGTLARDVRRGLARSPRSIPPKHFYDERGARLFDLICELPEYYLTRTEQALLDRHAPDVLGAARPSDLVELGSGAARKTRALLDAAAAADLPLRYRPFDVCEPAVVASARHLLTDYPWLEVHAVIADYEQHLGRLPAGRRRLVAFLGSTIGNFAPRRAARFLGDLAAGLRPGEHFLLGADLVKPDGELHAAYNDAAGVTAAFNRNLLLVVNRELGADFDPAAFDHVAFFDRRRSQIEMHLRATRAQRVHVAALELTVELAAGETIHTEISRKFTRRGLVALLGRTGFRLVSWFTPADESYALVLAERAG
jgi:L-histidine N-alpha-methyltransferase